MAMRDDRLVLASFLLDSQCRRRRMGKGDATYRPTRSPRHGRRVIPYRHWEVSPFVALGPATDTEAPMYISWWLSLVDCHGGSFHAGQPP